MVGSAVHAPALHDPATGLADQITIFRDRGLASDTLLWINFAIDQALAEMKAAGALRPRSVRRVAIIGPGLDFADKQEGYDFYPQQTIQPFALIDSIGRAGLAARLGVGITAFDVSRAVLDHLESARARAETGGRLHRRAATQPRSAVDGRSRQIQRSLRRSRSAQPEGVGGAAVQCRERRRAQRHVSAAGDSRDRAARPQRGRAAGWSRPRAAKGSI